MWAAFTDGLYETLIVFEYVGNLKKLRLKNCNFYILDIQMVLQINQIKQGLSIDSNSSSLDN